MRRRRDDVLRPRNDLGSDFLFDNMCMNGLRLLEECEEETVFLIAKLPSLLSLYLTKERGGGISASMQET